MGKNSTADNSISFIKGWNETKIDINTLKKWNQIKITKEDIDKTVKAKKPQ